MGWEQSDSKSISSEIHSVKNKRGKPIPSPEDIANRRIFLGEAGMEGFIETLLKKLGRKWNALKEPEEGTIERWYLSHAVEAGLLVHENGRMSFPDKAQLYLGQHSGLMN